MTATAEAWQKPVPTLNFKQRKRLPRSMHDRRKPLNQAIFAPVLSTRAVRSAAWYCIKDGKNIDPPYNTGNDFVYNDDFADPIAHYKEITSQATKSNPESMGRFHTA